MEENPVWIWASDNWKQEWAVLTGAPAICFLMVSITGLIVWFIAQQYFKGVISTLRAHVDLHRDRAESLTSSGPIPNRPVGEWPPLSDAQIQQWMKALSHSPIKSLKLAYGSASEAVKLCKSIRAIGKQLNVEVQLIDYPAKEHEFTIMATKNDPVAERVWHLCKIIAPHAELRWLNYPPATIGNLSIIIGEKPVP